MAAETNFLGRFFGDISFRNYYKQDLKNAVNRGLYLKMELNEQAFLRVQFIGWVATPSLENQTKLK